ncbi:MAG: hypothetical protein ACYSW8_24070 [Planctomycetota bacterium]|jgi:hypothetical protein
MARSLVHHRAGLDHFLLRENHYDSVDLSDVTSVTVQVGSTTVYSTAYNSGPVRWNTSETKRGEIVALVPTAGFTTDSALAQITIYSPTYPAGLLWATLTIPVGDAAFFGQGGEHREQCDVCGRWFPVAQLIRQTHILRREARDNALYYSRYDSEGWEIDTDALGDISQARSRVYWKVHPYKNANMADGAQSFWGDGELVAKDAIDLSAFTSLLMRGRFGTHQATLKPNVDIEFGFYYDYGGAGEVRYALGTREDIEGKTAWITDDLSSISPGHLSALKAFYKVTTYDDQQIWWVENMRVQKDATEPGLTTAIAAGAPIDDAFLMKTYGKTVVCQDHRLHMEKQVNEYQTTTDTVEVVENEDEEF